MALLVGIVGLLMLAVTGSAKAHENCVHRESGDWTLTGCVSLDGIVTWTAVDIFGGFYLWTDGEWHLQQQPPIPDVDLFPESNNAARVKFGLPALGKIDGGRIVYSHALDNDDDGVWTSISVTGVTNNRHFPLASLRVSCNGRDTGLRGYTTVTISALARYGPSEYHAWLDKVGPSTVKVAFGSIAPYRWTDFSLSTGDRSVGLSGWYPKCSWEKDTDKAQRFLLELMKQDHLTVRLPEVDGPIIAYFDLDGVFDTPVQHLLAHCLEE